MTSDEALWVAQQYLKTHQPGRVGMLLSDEAELGICKALVHACELVDAQDVMLRQAQAREDGLAKRLEEQKQDGDAHALAAATFREERDALRAQLDAVTQVATEPSGISTAVVRCGSEMVETTKARLEAFNQAGAFLTHDATEAKMFLGAAPNVTQVPDDAEKRADSGTEVREDRTKPPPGYDVYSRPGWREGQPFWWSCSSDGEFQAFWASEQQAIDAAWADYDARKAGTK